MKYPEIPQDIAVELNVLRAAAALSFEHQEWETAAARYEQTYSFLIKEQTKHGERYHKGWELYNWGISLIHLDHNAEGIKKILLAYVEDILSEEEGFEENADLGPARMSFIGIDSAMPVLDAIKQASFELKSEVAPDAKLHPEAAFERACQRFSADELRAALGVDLPSISAERRRIQSIVSPFELRCFIGCSYFKGGPNFQDLRDTVVEVGFDPIVPREFEIPEDDVHRSSLQLLHLCKSAIFEVSDPAGQLMELERCRDYSITPLILRQTMPDANPDMAQVSAMIGTMAGTAVSLYSSIDQMKDLIRAHLALG